MSKPKKSELNSRSDNPLPFILPLIAFMIIAQFHPDFAESLTVEEGEVPDMTKTWWYLGMIGFEIVLSIGLLVWFRKVYLEHFPLKFSPLAIVAGVVGIVLWIVLCGLGLEPPLLKAIGMDMSRPSFNPFTIGDDTVRLTFIVLRFTMLAAMIPIIEELFIRGWLVRWIENPSWENIRLDALGPKALVAASIYGVATHPSEALAAIVWFGLVTILVYRTGNLWDAVVAHAVTNFLLGVYVMWFAQWHLW